MTAFGTLTWDKSCTQRKTSLWYELSVDLPSGQSLVVCPGRCEPRSPEMYEYPSLPGSPRTNIQQQREAQKEFDNLTRGTAGTDKATVYQKAYHCANAPSLTIRRSPRCHNTTDHDIELYKSIQ